MPDPPPLDYRTSADLSHRPRGPNTTGSGPGIPPDHATLRRVVTALRNLPPQGKRPGRHGTAPDESRVPEPDHKSRRKESQ